MKAFMLAAGLGTRLRPLTENRPKVMVEVGGKKILERTILQLKDSGVDDLIINTHYFPEAVQDFFGDGSKWGVKIRYSFEPTILGTAGGLKKVEADFKNEKEFLVIYGDNVYDVDFKKIVDCPLLAKSPGLVVLFDRTKNPNSGAAGGVVEVGADGMISGFYEGMNRPNVNPVRDNNSIKSLSPHQKGFLSPSVHSSVVSNGVNLVNGGVYKFTADIFKFIREKSFYDFGKQVFPDILASGGKLQAYIIGEKEAIFGVDTLEYLEKANQYFKQL